MAYTPQNWRKLYSLVDKQMDPLRRLAWCEKSRQLMQERLIELSSDSEGPRREAETERREIETALRKVWSIEQKARRAQL